METTQLVPGERPVFPEMKPICDLLRLPTVLQLRVFRDGQEPVLIHVRQAEGTRWQVLATDPVDVGGVPADGVNFIAPPGETPDVQIGDAWDRQMGDS